METTDLVERVARAIWTAPITGQPEGHEVRQWPPKHPDAMTETLNQSKAAIAAYESALQARVEKLEGALKTAALDLHEAAGRFVAIKEVDPQGCSEVTREAARRADAALAEGGQDGND